MAVERDFYKLSDLGDQDLALLKLLFKDANPQVLQLHDEFLNTVLVPLRLAKKLRADPRMADQADALITYVETTILEEYHCVVEASFIPSLEQALLGDLSFFDDDDRRIDFFNFIATQYLRTKGIRERTLGNINGLEGANFTNIWVLMAHMYATQVGVSLYLNRTNLTLVPNRSSVQFITGDQPAINLRTDYVGLPTHFSIYYPISPSLALILPDPSEKDDLFPADGVTAVQAEALNRKLADACHRQVFGQTQADLERLL